MRNGNRISAFADFLSDGDTRLSFGILLAKYKDAVQGNWDNYDLANSDTCNSNDGEHNESVIEIGNEVRNNQTGNEDLDEFSDNNPDEL